MTRNAKNFQGVQANMYICRNIFKNELRWLKLRANQKKYDFFSAWADNFI
jgi:hypothetical protein